MNILTVLENEAAIPKMTEMISALQPDAEIMCFGSSLPALAAARRHEVDIAVLDVALQDLSGLEFGQYLQDLYPFVNLIYLAGSEESAYEAMTQHASGYLLKPATKELLGKELSDLRHPAEQTEFATWSGLFHDQRDKNCQA